MHQVLPAPSAMVHPESSVLVAAFPLFVVVAVTLLGALFGQQMLLAQLQQVLVRYFARKGVHAVDPALVYVPTVISPQQMLNYNVGILVLLCTVLWKLGAMWFMIILAPIATLLLQWVLLWSAEQQYIKHLNQALPPTLERLAAFLANNETFIPSLIRLINDMPDGDPLKAEWTFIYTSLEKRGADGTTFAVSHIVRALRNQTPSTRHRSVLDHVSVALDQTHDVLRQQVGALAGALRASDRRASAAVTEMAQMRASGMLIGGASLFITIYMAWMNPEKFLVAYTSNTLSIMIGVVMVIIISTPILLGYLFSRVPDIEF